LLAGIGTLALAVPVFSMPAYGQEQGPPAIAVAVADFDYKDTSGEPRDQTAEHAERLEMFGLGMRADLASSGKYRIVPITCGSSPCSAAQSDPAELVAAARRSGAKLLVYGGIQKMSTLIQHAKAEVIDVDADKLVLHRNMSFRGDSDLAWQRAQRVLARDMTSDRLRLGSESASGAP
jgi:hypothetical protein